MHAPIRGKRKLNNYECVFLTCFVIVLTTGASTLIVLAPLSLSPATTTRTVVATTTRNKQKEEQQQ